MLQTKTVLLTFIVISILSKNYFSEFLEQEENSDFLFLRQVIQTFWKDLKMWSKSQKDSMSEGSENQVQLDLVLCVLLAICYGKLVYWKEH